MLMTHLEGTKHKARCGHRIIDNERFMRFGSGIHVATDNVRAVTCPVCRSMLFPTLPMVTGQVLQFVRVLRRMSQSDVGDRAGLHTMSVSKIERGVVNLGVDTLIAVCAALNVLPVHVLHACIELRDSMDLRDNEIDHGGDASMVANALRAAMRSPGAVKTLVLSIHDDHDE